MRRVIESLTAEELDELEARLDELDVDELERTAALVRSMMASLDLGAPPPAASPSTELPPVSIPERPPRRPRIKGRRPATAADFGLRSK